MIITNKNDIIPLLSYENCVSKTITNKSEYKKAIRSYIRI